MPFLGNRPLLRALLAVGIVPAAIAVGACGGEGEGDGAAEGGAAGGDLEHIHGLGVSPRDGRLLIATHFGLFSSATGTTAVERVGESRQDIMGFSVAEPGRFIGSGHPEPDDPDLPSNVGLIESTDGGRSWEPVSLLGEADFHVLESSGDRVYGFDGTQGRLMVSDDGGRDWSQHSPPTPIFDLAIDPSDEDHLIVATEAGLLESDSAGEDWRPLSHELVGLIAWPSANRLHLIDATGTVRTSEDLGRSWRAVGSIGGRPAAFIAHDGSLYAALGDGSVQESADGGESWVVRAAP